MRTNHEIDYTIIGSEMQCVEIELDPQETVIAEAGAFMYMDEGIEMETIFGDGSAQQGTGLFGGEGFIMQKLEGDGLAFCHAGGHIIKRTLRPGEVLRVDTGCIVAYTQEVDYDIKFVGGVKNMLFGGEGVFFATLKGPGDVWLQTLPISRLASRVLAYGTSTRKEEGGILGSIFNGDGN